MNPIFTKSDLTKTTIKKTKNVKNIKTQIDSISDNEQYSNVNHNPQHQYQYEMILDINDIMRTIPNNAMTKPDRELEKTHTEWRWRFFDVKGRKLIEISKKHLCDDRMYVDNRGSWIHHSNTNEWDKFVVNTMYHYVES